MENQTPETGYAAVNDLSLYYEIHGAGEPLLLLHGGVVGIPMLASILPELARFRRVIAVELQGHGRTADVDRPLSFDAMADDVAGVLATLGIDRADVMGYSLGGEVALRLAMRHAALTRKLVVVSAAFKHDGWFPEVNAEFARMGPATAQPMWQSPLAQMFPQVNWDTLFSKIGELMSQDYDWSAEVSAITAPTMLVFADADSSRPAHIIEFYELLGGGLRDAGLDGSGRCVNRLAILPGQTHYDVIASPLLPNMVKAFLDGGTEQGGPSSGPA